MAVDHDRVNLIKIAPEVPCGVTEDAARDHVGNENIRKKQTEKMLTKSARRGGNGATAKETIVVNEATEDRRRTGRYLAIGVTLVMVFIAFYHTLLRHATFLAGLLAPAIIMLLYILWLFYFAKKKKPQVSTV